MNTIKITTIAASLALTLAAGQAQANWRDKLQSMWDQTATAASDAASGAMDSAKQAMEENWSAMPGDITVCAAKELKGWINEVVVPRFNDKAKRIKVEVEAHGSGELVDAMNNGNSMSCDVLIPGSDVSAMRWADFDIGKRKSVAYSATVWVGDKEKLDAARTFLGKAPGDALGCDDLATVAGQRRYSKIKQGGKGKLDVEMTTSNSGQTMYVSCVYSILDAIDADDVEDALNSNPEKEDAVRAFFKAVKFDVGSTTTLTTKAEGGFMHPNGIGYKHLAIATYESFLPTLTKAFAEQGKQLEVIYPQIVILNNFPATAVTTEGVDGQAAAAFMSFITGEEAQKELMRYGFRPANPKVSYAGTEAEKYFNNDIEVGDAPTNPAMLRDLWDIVSDDPKASAVKF